MTKDIRLSIGFLDHPKTIKLLRAVGSDGVFSLLRLWAYAAQYKTDGILTGMDLDDIEIACKWNGMQGALLSALLAHKWIDERADETGAKTYALHDWEEHQGYIVHEKDRVRQAKRAAAKRWGSRSDAPSNADSKQVAMLKHAGSNAPSPSPSPSPIPKDMGKKFIPPTLEEVSAYCQERANGVDPKRWFNHYTAKGWMIGKNKMKDWKAAVRTWENNQGGANSGSNQQNPRRSLKPGEPDPFEGLGRDC